MTLVGSTGGTEKYDETTIEASGTFKYGKAPTSPLPERVAPKRPPRTIELTSTTNTVTSVAQKTFSQPILKTTVCVEEQKVQVVEAKVNATKISPAIITITTAISSTIMTTTTVATTSAPSVPTRSTISPPSIGVTFDRRPSAGYNIIPHAALCQHRRSLQLNGDGGGTSKVRILNKNKNNRTFSTYYSCHNRETRKLVHAYLTENFLLQRHQNDREKLSLELHSVNHLGINLFSRIILQQKVLTF